MNNLYLITTAIEQNQWLAVLTGRFCIRATTELEAGAIALAGQPDNTFILSIEVYQPQIYACSFDPRDHATN